MPTNHKPSLLRPVNEIMAYVRLLVGVWLCLVVSAGAGRAAADVAGSQYVPYELSQGFGIPYIHVVLGDGVAATLVIDTGSIDSVLSDSMAATLGLTGTPVLGTGGAAIDFDGKPATSVTVPMTTIGDSHIYNLSFILIDHDHLTKVIGMPVDGVIGLNYLSRVAILWDYDQGGLTFFSPGRLRRHQIASLGFAHADTAPLSRAYDDGMFYLTASMADDVYVAGDDLLLDTGSPFTAITPDDAHNLHLPAQGNGGFAFPIGGKVALSTDTVASLKIGSYELPNHLVSFPADDQPRTFFHVGLDIFHGHRVLIDFPRRMMYIVTDTVSATVPPSPPRSTEAGNGRVEGNKGRSGAAWW
jgi:hypothetical protein